MVADNRRTGLTLARPIASLVANDPEMLRLMEEANDVMAGASTIKSVRKAAGLSQTELADRLHVSQARVCEMEAGRGTVGVSYALLLRAVRACGFEPVFSYRRRHEDAAVPEPARDSSRGAREADEGREGRSSAAATRRATSELPITVGLTPEERLLRAIFGEELLPDPNAPEPAPVPSRRDRRRGRRVRGFERSEDAAPDEPGALPIEEPEKDQLA